MPRAYEDKVPSVHVPSQLVRLWRLDTGLPQPRLRMLMPDVIFDNNHRFLAVNEWYQGGDDGKRHVVAYELSILRSADATHREPDQTAVWFGIMKLDGVSEAAALAEFRNWLRQCGYQVVQGVPANGECRKCRLAGVFVRMALVCPSCKQMLGGC